MLKSRDVQKLYFIHTKDVLGDIKAFLRNFSLMKCEG